VDELGREDTPSNRPPSRPARSFLVARVGAGVAAGALIFPAAFFLPREPVSQLLTILILVGTSGVLGAAAGHWVHRWELRSWTERMVRRTEGLFRGTPDDPVSSSADFETYLVELSDRLEIVLQGRLEAERDTIISVITSLISALEARDPHTRNHSARVAKLAVRVGREMGLPPWELYEIHLGGLLHDVGKIGIPDSILLKPGGLTPEEYDVMKGHSYLGSKILAGIPGLQGVADIVLNHHEMVDGRGYPQGISGEDIPLGARIVAVCDTYMSMAENRPYRQGRSLDRVMREIHRVAGRQLDVGVVDTLERLLEREVREFGRPIEGFSAPDSAEAQTEAA
jgi:putative nucleotidyltransferase with HDIG domain